MKASQGLPLKAHLALFCLICFIPACIAVAVIGLNVATSEQMRVERETLRMASDFSLSVDTEMSALTRVLQALASSPALVAGDFASFREQAVVVAQANGTAITLRTSDGVHVVNTLLPPGTEPMPVTTDPVLRAADARALASAKPVLSDLYIGASGRRPYVSVIVPVVVGDGGRYLLTMAVMPERILTRLKLGELADEGRLSSVIGSDFRVIARTRDLDRFSGRTATGDLVQAMQRQPSGTLLSRTLDGIDVLTAFHRSPEGWTTIVSVSVEQLKQPVRSLVHILLVVAAVALLATAIGAWAHGSYLGRQMALLAENAGRVGRHIPLKPFDWVVTEMGVAQQALAEASDKAEALLRELDHRVKNTLAVIQALAARTVGDPDDRETMIGRVAALAHAHEALSRRRWEAVPLRELVGAVCVPEGERLTYTGPAVELTPRATTSLAQVLQELWGNARVHGALTDPNGRVTLTWTVEDNQLSFTWQETGGPFPGPHAKGLGLKLIELCVVRQLNGRLAFGQTSEGWRVTFAVPMDGELGLTARLPAPPEGAQG